MPGCCSSRLSASTAMEMGRPKGLYQISIMEASTSSACRLLMTFAAWSFVEAQTIPKTGTVSPVSNLMKMIPDCKWSPNAPKYLTVDAVDEGVGLTDLDIRRHDPHRSASKVPLFWSPACQQQPRCGWSLAFAGGPSCKRATEVRISLLIGGPPSKYISVVTPVTFSAVDAFSFSWVTFLLGSMFSSSVQPKKKCRPVWDRQIVLWGMALMSRPRAQSQTASWSSQCTTPMCAGDVLGPSSCWRSMLPAL